MLTASGSPSVAALFARDADVRVEEVRIAEGEVIHVALRRARQPPLDVDGASYEAGCAPAIAVGNHEPSGHDAWGVSAPRASPTCPGQRALPRLRREIATTRCAARCYGSSVPWKPERIRADAAVPLDALCTQKGWGVGSLIPHCDVGVWALRRRGVAAGGSVFDEDERAVSFGREAPSLENAHEESRFTDGLPECHRLRAQVSLPSLQFPLFAEPMGPR